MRYQDLVPASAPQDARERAELQFAKDCALELGELIQYIGYQGFEVHAKADRSLVTSADHAANARFIERVAARWPHDRVLGEEGTRSADGPRTWIIDPLDGTTEFMRRIPVWMVSIALVERGRPVVAVAYNPSTRELYSATDEVGSPAFRNAMPIRVSKRDGVKEPVLICGTGANRDPGELSGTLLRATFEPELRMVELGGLPVVFAGCKVAEGSFDGFLYEFNGAHDLAAITLIIEHAGGLVTSIHGQEQPLDRPVDGGAGSNALIHGRLVRPWT